MAPQTRSRGVPPPSRVYHSTPAQQQAQFPARRRVVRTYGKQKRSKNAATPNRELRQQTLTQIDFVSSFSEEQDAIVLSDSDDDEEDKENRRLPDMQDEDGEEEDDDDDDDNDEEPVSSGRKRHARAQKATTKSSRAKRRRTLGDGIEKTTKEDAKSRRKTLGDAPSSSYQTQTLTQFLGRSSYIKDSEDEGEGDNDDDDFQTWLQDPPSPSPQQNKSKEASESPMKPQDRSMSETASSQAESIVPQTPAKKAIRFEIPSSSQLSTPVSAMMDRYGPPDVAADQTPSKGKPPASVTVPDELPGKPTPRRPGLVVEDTFESRASGEATPVQRPREPLREKTPPLETSSLSEEPLDETPTKPRRRDRSAELGERAISSARKKSSLKSPSPKKTKVSPHKGKNVLLEIPDSDEEDDGDDDDEQDENEAPYVAGPETQYVLDELASSEEASGDTTPTPTPAKPSSVTARQTSPAPPPHAIPPSSPKQQATPRPPRRRLRKPLTNTTTAQATQTQFESQRVPVTTLQGLPQATPRSDILLPVSEEDLCSITGGYQTHLALSFKIPPLVVRFWLHDGNTLRYMACAEAGRLADGGWHYALDQVYELNNPMSDEDMREEEWYDGDIGRYVYLPPAIVGQLLWNLRHAIFGHGNEDDADNIENHETSPTLPNPGSQSKMPIAPASSISVSQQVEAQLQSDIAHSTQFHHSDDIIPSTPEEENALNPPSINTKIASSSPTTHIRPPPPSSSHSRPQQPTCTPTSYRASRSATKPSEPSSVIRPSQATTVSQASTPEKTTRRPSSHPRPHPALAPSSSLNFADCDGSGNSGESPLRLPPGYSYPSSSQLLTKSQLLPDSLVRDDERLPPEIWASDEE